MTPAHATPSPSPWVARYLPQAPAGTRLLDVACGGGRHIRYALGRGWAVTGIDRDLMGVSDLAGRPGVELIAADLEGGAPFPTGNRTFAAVVVTNYLWRPILPDIVAAVAANGVLIYETFAVGNARYGRPSNPDFLLNPGELISAVQSSLIPLAYEHATLTEPDRVVARIVACGRDHPWLGDPPRHPRGNDRTG